MTTRVGLGGRVLVAQIVLDTVSHTWVLSDRVFGATHQVFPREDLQEGDQVMSISEILIEVRHVTLRLEEQHRDMEKKTIIIKGQVTYKQKSHDRI